MKKIKCLFLRLVTILTALIVSFLPAVNAHACTLIYVGDELTEDGSVFFGRSEDTSTDYNKLFFYCPAGTFAAGEQHTGCFGFTWTFTHDSYAHTAFLDDNLSGTCPYCETTHDHMPFESAGTNEKGLTVSATVTIDSNEAVMAEDPFTKPYGIGETEIPTILLGECASAKEALFLLIRIYEETGAFSGSGILLSDPDETWYVENLSGRQYIAVRLGSDIIVIGPNMPVIGRIDLDDPVNVIASNGLIETAIRAGCFVGNQKENIIDFTASYSREKIEMRMVNALNFLDSEKVCTTDNLTEEDYAISNIDENGNITVPYTAIKTDRKLSVQDIIAFYHLPKIGKPENAETHIFQLKGSEETDIIEWVSMCSAAYSVFVPYYPRLIRETIEEYQVGTERVIPDFSGKEPKSGMWFAGYQGGYVTLPENWRDSFYWVCDALSHIADSDEEKANKISGSLSLLQEDVITMWEDAQDMILGEIETAGENKDKVSALATEASNHIARNTFERLRKIVDDSLQ